MPPKENKTITKTTMKSPNTFIQEFFDILRTYPKRPGSFVKVEKKQLPQPTTILDMRVYIDTSFQATLKQNRYQYIEKHSSADEICLLDLTPGVKEYTNRIDKIEYAYDSEKDEVIERVIWTNVKEML